MNTTIVTIVVSIFIPLTAGLLWTSLKHPKKYSKLVWGFWNVILVACFAIFVFNGGTSVYAYLALEEALETGEHIASHAKTLLGSLRWVGLSLVIAAGGQVYFWAIGRIGEILNEDDEEDTPAT